MRLLCLLILLLSSLPGQVLAVDSRPLPSSPEQSRINLTEEWRNSGAARLYWNSLVSPRQIQQGGASFRDPATVPELPNAQPAEPKKARGFKKNVSRAKDQTKAELQPAPANAGSTALKAPAAASALGKGAERNGVNSPSAALTLPPTQSISSGDASPLAPFPAPTTAPVKEIPPLTSSPVTSIQGASGSLPQANAPEQSYSTRTEPFSPK